MGIVLANPWGLAALAALPVLVVIHSLRQRSRRVRASTLFLLEHVAPRPTEGTRLDRFEANVPFWMQAAALTAIAWLLAEPRWIRADSRQVVAVVLDGSVSMAAFRGPTRRALERAVRSLAAVSARTDWHLLETGPRRPPLVAGDRPEDLLAAFDAWHPAQGTHDFGPALAIAASLAPPDKGVVLLVTDRDVPVPPGVAVIAAGTPIDNVGFVGADSVFDETSGERRYRALVSNHGDTPAERVLAVAAGDAGGTAPVGGAATPLSLAAGATRAVEGPWPAGATRVVLSLDADEFPEDDVAPIERSSPRVVRAAVRAGTPAGDLLGRMILAAGDSLLVDDPADADLVVEPLGTAGDLPAIQVAPPAEEDSALDPAPVAAGDDPHVRDLAWGALLSGPGLAEAPLPGDDVLLWKGVRPLVVRRPRILPDAAPRGSLLLGFDVEASNAARLPALVVLLARFIEEVRGAIDRPWSGTFQADEILPSPETATTLAVAPLVGPGPAGVRPFRGRAPRETSFFTVARSDGSVLLSGAAQRLDPREGDFRAAAAVDTVSAARAERIRRQSVADPWIPGWVAILVAALFTAWWFSSAVRVTPPGDSA